VVEVPEDIVVAEAIAVVEVQGAIVVAEVPEEEEEVDDANYPYFIKKFY
jgi:hypothetical protein